MSSILRAKTLKQRASARDESKEVKRHGRKNAQSLIVTVLCLPVTGHHIPYPDYGYQLTSRFSGPSLFQWMAIARSRDFLWTRKVLFRDNVEHSSGQNVETTSLSARQKGRVETTWVKECSKPYRNRPLLACYRSPYTLPRLWLPTHIKILRSEPFPMNGHSTVTRFPVDTQSSVSWQCRAFFGPKRWNNKPQRETKGKSWNDMGERMLKALS